MPSETAGFEMEARIQGKDEQYRWCLIRYYPLRDEQGRVLRWYGTRTDSQDRKRADEELRKNESAKRAADLAVAGERLRSEQIKRAGAEEAARAGEQRFRAVADSLPDPLPEIAPDHRYRLTNMAFPQWFGLTSQRTT